MLHRDVKPANILVDLTDREAGHAVLTDFGIARAFDYTSTLTGTSATVAYAAPGTVRRHTGRSPGGYLFAGCTLFETLTVAGLSRAPTRRPSSPRTSPRGRRGPPNWCRTCPGDSTTSSRRPWPRIRTIAIPIAPTLAEAALLALDAPHRPARVSPARSINSAVTIR
ncbi:protein kinase domain-containing protein [Streptomyces murinus]|uniref:protein kinase domain-containing protein n=1 Tax=Streptomyces murinus TaxID=33900 RepID=UPI003F48AED3